VLSPKVRENAEQSFVQILVDVSEAKVLFGQVRTQNLVLRSA